MIVKKDVDTSTFFEVAVKCLKVFGAEQKPRIALVLKNIVFNSAFYPPETLMDNVRLEAADGTLKTCLEDICQVYNVCLNLVSDFLLVLSNSLMYRLLDSYKAVGRLVSGLGWRTGDSRRLGLHSNRSLAFERPKTGRCDRGGSKGVCGVELLALDPPV